MAQPTRLMHRLRVHVHAVALRQWSANYRAPTDPFTWADHLLRAMDLPDARVVAIGQRWNLPPLGGYRPTDRPGFDVVIQYIDPWETRD